MLRHAVSANTNSAMVSHVVPEILCCGFEIGIAAFEFRDSLESDELRHLSVSVLTVEESAAVRRESPELLPDSNDIKCL